MHHTAVLNDILKIKEELYGDDLSDEITDGLDGGSHITELQFASAAVQAKLNKNAGGTETTNEADFHLGLQMQKDVEEEQSDEQDKPQHRTIEASLKQLHGNEYFVFKKKQQEGEDKNEASDIRATLTKAFMRYKIDDEILKGGLQGMGDIEFIHANVVLRVFGGAYTKTSEAVQSAVSTLLKNMKKRLRAAEDTEQSVPATEEQKACGICAKLFEPGWKKCPFCA